MTEDVLCQSDAFKIENLPESIGTSEELFFQIKSSVEFILSLENLQKDIFFRRVIEKYDGCTWIS